MRKRIAHFYLAVSIVALILLISLNNYGVFDNINIDLSGYVNSTNDIIFNFFNSIPIIYAVIGLIVILYIKQDTRHFSLLLLVQTTIVCILMNATIYICDSLNVGLEYKNYLNQDILYLYSTILMIILNYKKVVKTGTLRILVFIAMFLFLIMVTASEFYFGGLTIFGLLFNITIVCIVTSITYVLVFIRNYYFL